MDSEESRHSSVGLIPHHLRPDYPTIGRYSFHSWTKKYWDLYLILLNDYWWKVDGNRYVKNKTHLSSKDIDKILKSEWSDTQIELYTQMKKVEQDGPEKTDKPDTGTR